MSGGEEIQKKVRHGSLGSASPSKRVSSIPGGRGSVALYNDTYSVVSTGRCVPSWSWTLQVSNGIISGPTTSGRVSGGGAISGAMEVVGTTYNFVGHMHRDEASGTWKSRPGCFGTWTATRS